MPDWFTAGGWIMWFLGVVGVVALLAAADFVRRPDPSKVERIRALSSAVAWTVLTGVATDLATVGQQIPAKPKWAHSPDLPLLVMQGISESLSPAILGGAVLSVVALLVAAGHARLRVLGTAP